MDVKLLDPAVKLLSEKTLKAFTEERPAKLWSLHKTSTIADALQVLGEHRILSVPVVDDKGEYAGCLSVGDVLSGLTSGLTATLGHTWVEKIDELTLEEFNGAVQDFLKEPLSIMYHAGDLWLKNDPSGTLMSVVTEGFKIHEPPVHHRIFVCDPELNQRRTSVDKTTVVNIPTGSLDSKCTGFRPTQVVSQFDVVNLLWQHKAELGEVVNKTVDELGLCLGTAFTVSAGMRTLAAFEQMAIDRKNGLAVVGKDGELLANLSVGDLRGLDSETFGLLLLPVADFIAVRRGKGPSPAEALKGARPDGAAEGDWAKVLKDLPAHTVRPSTTLGEMLDILMSRVLHRVYVVDEKNHPTSVITLADTLRCFTQAAKPIKDLHHKLREADIEELEDWSEDEEEDDDAEEEEAK